MFRFLSFCLLSTWMALIALAAARADTSEFLGHWSQVQSSGGRCTDCTVSIGGDDGHLHVDASNGWSATLKQIDVSGTAVLIGGGRWDESKAGRFYGQPVATEFRVRGQRLYLEFFTKDRKGRHIRVKAVFEREIPSA